VRQPSDGLHFHNNAFLGARRPNDRMKADGGFAARGMRATWQQSFEPLLGVWFVTPPQLMRNVSQPFHNQEKQGKSWGQVFNIDIRCGMV
jgi:hypothetical protein